MSTSHKSSKLPIAERSIPIDGSTAFLAHYDIHKESIQGERPLGAYPDEDGLVLYYDFSEPNSYARDLSGMDNHGLLSGTSLSTDGINGMSLSFGTSKILVDSMRNCGYGNNFTLEAWIKPSAYPSEMACIVLVGGRYLSLSSDGSVNTYCYGITNPGYNASAAKVAIGSIAHIVHVYDGAYTRIYVNGVQDAAIACTGTPSSSLESKLEIGMENSSRTFAGNIYKVVVYNRAITADEVKKHYISDVSSIVLNGKYGHGVAVQKLTSNLLAHGTFDNKTVDQVQGLSKWGGTDGTATYVDDVPYGLTGLSAKIDCTVQGTGGIYFDTHSYTLTEGKTYTYSFYAKARIRQDVSGHVMSMNRISDNLYILQPNVSLTNKWKRYSYTFTVGSGQGGTFQTRHILYAMNTVWITGLQVEESVYPTAYVQGSRIPGKLWYDRSLINPLSFTISMWFNIPYMHRVSAGNTGSNGCWYHPLIEIANSNDGNGQLSLCCGPEPSSWLRKVIMIAPVNNTCSYTIQDNTWYHMVLTFDGSVYRTYFNGDMQQELSGSAIALGPNSVLMVGGGWYGAPNIIIDELRIDKVACSAHDALAWYLSGAPAHPKDPLKIVG
jgi:hypothetical protein